MQTVTFASREEFFNKIEAIYAATNRQEKSIRDLYSPSLLKNNIAAAEYIADRLTKGDKMVIVGDYDADGIMATAILYGFFIDIGMGELVEYIIPDRFKDGYGISRNMVDIAATKGAKFIVTVDNGISAVDAVAYAKEKGIDVIITDHHTVPSQTPEAEIIVNPKQKGETFPFIDISGATVAWYLTAALKTAFGVPNYNLAKNLDLVGITVISDVMPLKDINIALAKYAIKSIREGKRPIYSAVWSKWAQPVVDEKAIGYGFVPLLNATGRLSHASLAVEWIMARDTFAFSAAYTKIKALNKKRQDLTEDHLKRARNYIAQNWNRDRAIVIKVPDFHEGIIGIVAGKIAEEYKVPAYVFTYNRELGLWKGSARTVGDVHLYNLTKSVSEFVAGFGGHKKALGLTVEDDKFQQFQEALLEKANSLDKKMFKEKRAVLDVNLEWLDFEFLKMRAKYAPFGEENEEPLFRVSPDKSKIRFVRELGGGKHMEFAYEDKKIVFFRYEKREVPDSFLIEPTYEYNPYEGKLNIAYVCRV